MIRRLMMAFSTLSGKMFKENGYVRNIMNNDTWKSDAISAAYFGIIITPLNFMYHQRDAEMLKKIKKLTKICSQQIQEMKKLRKPLQQQLREIG